MGDMADDAAAAAEEDYFEWLGEVAAVTKLTNPELVAQIELHHQDADEPMSTWEALDEKQAQMAVGICKWYRDKGFLTLRQREALISIVAMLWTE